MVHLADGFTIILQVLVTDIRTEIDFGYADFDGFLDGFWLHTRAAMQNQGNIRKGPDFSENIQLDIWRSLVVTVRVSDTDCQCVWLTKFKKLPHLVWIGGIFIFKRGTFFIESQQLADFSFNRHAKRVTDFDYLIGKASIFFDR